MRCPACDGDLIPVETEGHYGTRLEVDACTSCGGFWLDAGEPVALGHQAATALDGGVDLSEVDTEPREDFRACPRCGRALEEVTGGRLPAGLRLDTCRQCRGMWFDRGELLVFKSGLEARRRRVRDEQMKKLRAERTRRMGQPARGYSPGGAAMMLLHLL